VATVVFDIETVGGPWESLDDGQRTYLGKWARSDEDRARLPESLSLWPLTGRIVVLGMVNPDSGRGRVWYEKTDGRLEETSADGLFTFVGDTEAAFLAEFWMAIAKFDRFVSFNVPVVSRAAYGRAKSPADLDRRPEGSGPYRLEKWDTNQSIALVRRPGTAETAAPFRRVVFRVLPEKTVRFRAGSRGELDEFRIDRDQRSAAQSSKDFLARNRILKVPQPIAAYLLWNVRQPFLAAPAVRRALASAWPRGETAHRLYPPDGATLVSGPYLPGAPENDPSTRPPAHDPALAGRLLDEAGWRLGRDGMRSRDGRKASFELLYPTGQAIYGSLGEILQSSYRKVGVELVLRPLDWAAYSERSDAGEFEALLTGRVFLPPNPDPFPHFHSSQAPPLGQNYGFYRNVEADRWMESARREPDAARRIAAYRQVHRLLAADPPADFLWGADQYWGISRKIDGVSLSPLGLFHFLPGPLAWRPAKN
jgi:peptide/nickel transport system substrate-binding protein